MKTCRRCGKIKPLSKFHKDKNRSDGHYAYCKACVAEVQRARYERDHDAIRAYHNDYRAEHRDEFTDSALRRLYDLSLEDYDLMLEAQSNGCAICGKSPEENGKRLFVDHNHDTGDVRGLLCSTCNSGIGMLQDSSELCRRAMLYLKES